MRRAVIFDWGGVLMRTMDYGPRHAWDRRLGLPLGRVESIVHGIPEWQQAQIGDITPDHYWDAVGLALNLTAIEQSQLRAEFYSGDRVDTAMITLIEVCRARHVLVGLLSNNTSEILDDLATLNIIHLFDACVISAITQVMKPAPEAYHAILNELGVDAPHALFVDDAPPNVAGAHAIGMTAVRFSGEGDLRHALFEWLKDYYD